MEKLRVLVVGLGSMGMSHALAYTRIPDYEVVGVCTRHIDKVELPEALAGAKKFSKFEEALAELKPDVVSVNTLPDTHADYAIKAMEAGAHVFVEKPLADSVANAEKVVETARRTGKKLVVGYILRQHPSWNKFIEIARELPILHLYPGGEAAMNALRHFRSPRLGEGEAQYVLRRHSDQQQAEHARGQHMRLARARRRRKPHMRVGFAGAGLRTLQRQQGIGGFSHRYPPGHTIPLAASAGHIPRNWADRG